MRTLEVEKKGVRQKPLRKKFSEKSSQNDCIMHSEIPSRHKLNHK